MCSIRLCRAPLRHQEKLWQTQSTHLRSHFNKGAEQGEDRSLELKQGRGRQVSKDRLWTAVQSMRGAVY